MRCLRGADNDLLDKDEIADRHLAGDSLEEELTPGQLLGRLRGRCIPGILHFVI